MKVACIAPSQVPSSTANSIQLMKVCHALAQEGHHVCLWVPAFGPVSSKREKKDNSSADWEALARHYGLTSPFEIRWLPSWSPLHRYDFTLNAVRQARDWGADLVYTWMLQAAALGVKMRMPVVLELHDLPSGRFGPRLFRYFAEARPAKKRLLVITRALLKRLLEEYAVTLDAETAQVAPNGADLESYADLPRSEFARQILGLKDGLTAVYAGHFYPGRGMDLLLGLAQAMPTANFLWVGGRPADVVSWQGRLAGLGLNNVHLTGFIENRHLPLYQAAGDVLLMPYERSISGSSGGNSADICSPMKMFDYLACGRAILTSELPVLHEVLNERNAVFCPPQDLEAWRQALSELFSDESRRIELGEHARQDATLYTWRGRVQRALQGW